MSERPFTPHPSPFILSADPDFADLALEELREAGGRVTAELGPGVWLVVSPGGFLAVAERWRRQPPIFVRHICPAQITVSLAGTADLAALQQAMRRELLDLLDPTLPFSVQTRLFPAPDGREPALKPFDVNHALAELAQTMTGAPLNVRAPQQVVSVVVAGRQAHLGVSLTAHNLSDWAGGARRFAREPGQISRAEFKLLEALEVFAIHLPPRGVALDLGAAPGGWTRVLRQREQYVTALDPAELHPSLQADAAVRHKRMTAEAYLADEPDTFDLIVNDMRLDARDSARLMVGYGRCLYPHGLALMTFKLPAEGRRQALDHAFNILRHAYEIAGARQLFHNRSEITVYLRRPAP
jgi:23S rRNA (cytidine2498-2'-O)-methyltransferase